jgi:hypothetical protein
VAIMGRVIATATSDEVTKDAFEKDAPAGGPPEWPGGPPPDIGVGGGIAGATTMNLLKR